MSSTRTQSQLCTATPISSFVQCPISFQLLPSSVPTFNLIEISWSNQMSIAEWVYVYGIHHRRVIWSSYRKLTLVGFEPTTSGTLKKRFSVCDVKEFVDYCNRHRKANFSERVYIYIYIYIYISFYIYFMQSPLEGKILCYAHYSATSRAVDSS